MTARVRCRRGLYVSASATFCTMTRPSQATCSTPAALPASRPRPEVQHGKPRMLLLSTALAREVMSRLSFRPSVCFHLRNRLTVDLDHLQVSIGHDHSSQGTECQGRGSRSWLRLMRSVRPRARAVLLVHNTSVT